MNKEKKPVRLALVGCGGMGRAHAVRFSRLQGRLQLVALVDANLEKAEALAKDVPGAKASPDYTSLFNEDVDAVLLALPHHLHAQAAVDFLKAGKHVFLEKPMANSEEECQRILEAESSSGKTLMIGYCMRFHPLVTAMKKHLDQETCGPVYQVSLWTEQHTEPQDPNHWIRSAQKLGGGQLFSHGCHYIDLLLWFLGPPVKGVHMGTNQGTPWMEREGTSHVCIEFEGGKLGYHFGTWGARGTRLGYSFHAHCEAGMIEARFASRQLLSHVKGKETVLLEVDEAGKHTENELSHFIDCIQSGSRPAVSAQDSLQGLRVIWRLYEAEDRGTLADLRGLSLTGSSPLDTPCQ